MNEDYVSIKYFYFKYVYFGHSVSETSEKDQYPRMSDHSNIFFLFFGRKTHLHLQVFFATPVINMYRNLKTMDQRSS